MCWHKWSKWKQYVESGCMLFYKTGKEYPYDEKRQKRTCLKCGKVQDEEIN